MCLVLVPSLLFDGEQQRIALARLFLKQCKLILADEPTGSLDAKNAQIIMDMLLSLNAEGKPVIIVTHDQKIKIGQERLSNLEDSLGYSLVVNRSSVSLPNFTFIMNIIIQK